ncbi:MAG TPA: LysM peptidoglycan-binding domain-containing protein [Solirubrobacteraceae bacterium]|nr:LysM peptidoglycan-binding domain-containing protein [Solirubrobacteraceae bacterium]
MAAADQSQFQKARLEIEGGRTLTCLFNPNEYAISKANVWTVKPVVGASLPSPQFSGGHARELTLNLLFDADPSSGDVSSATDALFAMMEVNSSLASGRTNQARPPTITFAWGTFTSFKAVCSRLNVQFTMFKPDGTPIRATAALTLIQVEKDPRSGQGTPAPPQNPTTRAERMRVHVVRAGDSLQSIAYAHYRDPNRWRTIADENGIDDPLSLERGAELSVPLLRS